MPTTTRLLLPYPTPDDEPQGAQQIQALAERVDAVVVTPFAGDLKLSARVNEHGNWIKADGRALAAGQYDALRNALIADGSPYGSSGGNPLVPDMRGRVGVGAGAGAGLTSRANGQKGGEESHLLTADESGIADHDHNVTAHNFGGAAPALVSGAGMYATKTFIRGDDSNAFASVGSLGKRSGSGYQFGYGVGGVPGGERNATLAHNNMPPYTVGTWFIYAA